MKKRRDYKDIVIDLTSLLDVIFIILMVVIANQQKLSNDTDSELEKAKAAELKATAQYEMYKDVCDSVKNYNTYISVYSNYEENLVTRHVYVLDKDEEIAAFTLEGKNTEKQMQELTELLTGLVTEDPEKPVVLSLNEEDDAILYRDEKAIKAVFDKLKEYPNVYTK